MVWFLKQHNHRFKHNKNWILKQLYNEGNILFDNKYNIIYEL
jgi:hypothetical protein